MKLSSIISNFIDPFIFLILPLNFQSHLLPPKNYPRYNLLILIPRFLELRSYIKINYYIKSACHDEWRTEIPCNFLISRNNPLSVSSFPSRVHAGTSGGWGRSNSFNDYVPCNKNLPQLRPGNWFSGSIAC